MALEQGKEVYAVPGRVTDRLSDGCNRLIKQGAGVFLSPEDFLRELGRETGQEGRCGANSVTAGEKTALPANLSGEQLEICRVLELQPMTLEQIQERLSREYPWARLMQLLMSLCVEGVVSQISPGQFSLRGV
jgi:DNA processing protein